MSPTTTTLAPPQEIEPDESLVIPAWVVDYDSFRRWSDSHDYPERGRISWFDGEWFIDMSPQEVDTHGRVKDELHYGLTGFTRERDIGELLGDPTRYVHDETRIAHEPDAIVVLWESLAAGRVAYREVTAGSGRVVEVAGSPDLVVEVVSRSSVRKDLRILPRRYFAAGVREYWIVDARGREISFRLLTRGDDAFEERAPDADGFRPSPMLGASFALSRGLNAHGVHRYRLDWR